MKSKPLLRKLVHALSPHVKSLSLAAYVTGLICVCVFPSFDRKTEIEEHGLIAGIPRSTFPADWQQELRARVKHFQSVADPAVGLELALKEAHCVAYRMNFSTSSGGNGSLTYTVASSRRGDSREALVLVAAADMRPNSNGAPAAFTISVGVTLAKYFKVVQWLAKDVIIIFVDNSQPYGAGTRAWLRSYLGGTSAVRRGVLRQAIVLDIPTNSAELLLDVEGTNGRLPNQDIVNTFVSYANKLRGLTVRNREAWESVFHTFLNGGVHSNHAPFLELQVPSFTIKGLVQKKSKDKVDVVYLTQAVECTFRSLGNALQQLHHSFNFYFFTGPSRHISNGLYLYPLIGMLLPLASFLLSTNAYQDFHSFLVGLGSIALVVFATGAPVFLLGTNEYIVDMLASWVPVPRPPACTAAALTREGSEVSWRTAAALWLSTGAVGVLLVGVFLRRYAKRTELPLDDTKEGSKNSVQKHPPLWDAVRSSSGFALGTALFTITFLSWSIAAPLTAVCIPVAILVRPFSFRQRPLRTLFVATFLLVNLVLLAVEPETREKLWMNLPSTLHEQVDDAYLRLLKSAPREAQPYLPTGLFSWLREGDLAAALSGDLLVGLYSAAQDYNCAGGMLFPVFCFVYLPVLAFLVLVGIILPPHRVADEQASLTQAKYFLITMMVLLCGCLCGGVVWKSYSSSGLGSLQW